jgi:hypothetical protein
MLTDPKAIEVFNVLIKAGLIPSEGQFEITEEILQASYETYPKLYPPKTYKQLKPKEIDYIKRLAAMNLTKLNKQRANDESVVKTSSGRLSIECGFVYVISNPAYEGYYKVGITNNIQSRLASYQTYDPLKRFKVEHYRFVSNRREVEKQILQSFNKDLVKGEWVNSDEVKAIIVGL